MILITNASLFLSEEYVHGQLSINEITDRIEVFNTNPEELYKLPLYVNQFQTVITFNANKNFSKNLGTIQGEMKIVFDQLQCRCTFGYCTEIQQLDASLRQSTVSFDQPYQENVKQFSFQVRKNQLIGQSEYVAATYFNTMSSIMLQIKPQNAATEQNIQQICTLSLNITTITRQYANTSEKHLISVENSSKASKIVLKPNSVITAKGNNDFTLISFKSDRPLIDTVESISQLNVLIIIAALYFCYTIVDQFLCSKVDVDKLFEEIE